MCKLKKYKGRSSRPDIDECMRPLIQNLSGRLTSEFKVIGCCCGHGKYPITLVTKHPNSKYPSEMFSNKLIPRVRKIYKRDKQGYYYIPETVLPTKHNSG